MLFMIFLICRFAFAKAPAKKRELEAVVNEADAKTDGKEESDGNIPNLNGVEEEQENKKEKREFVEFANEARGEPKENSKRGTREQGERHENKAPENGDPEKVPKE